MEDVNILSFLRKWLGVLCPLLGLGMLVACSAAAPLTTYELSALRADATLATSSPNILRGLLVIEEPSAISPLDSDRIVVRDVDSSLSYLKGAQWSSRLPRLLQSRLIESFENQHVFTSVSSPKESLKADFRLVSDVRRFEIDTTSREAVVELSVKMIEDQMGRVVKGRVFSVRLPLEESGYLKGAAAAEVLDRATRKMTLDLISWLKSPLSSPPAKAVL